MLMREDPSLKVIRNKQGFLIFSDGDITIGSTNCLDSKTLFPNIKEDAKSGVPIVDCAGFQDTRSPEMDFTAAFINKNMLDSVKEMKIVIVENWSNVELNNVRDGFPTNLKHVSTLIKDNIDCFSNSICLVVTKVVYAKGFDESNAQNAIKVFLDTTRQHIESSLKISKKEETEDLKIQIKIIDFLLDGNYYQHFCKPVEEVSPWAQDELKANFNQICTLVFDDLKFSTPFHTQFKFAVAPDTLIYVNKTVLPDSKKALNKVFQELAGHFKQKFCKELLASSDLPQTDLRISKVEDVCQSYLNIFKELSSFESVIKYATDKKIDENFVKNACFQWKKLNFLLPLIGKTAVKERATVKDFLISWQQCIEHIQSVLHSQKLLSIMSRDFESYQVRLFNDEIRQMSLTLNQTSDLKMFLQRGFSVDALQASANVTMTEFLVKELKAMIEEKTQESVQPKRLENGGLCLQGDFVILSQQHLHFQNLQNVGEMVIVGKQKVYVDCDVDLQNTHLDIASPEIEAVEKRRCILLRGEDGKPVEKAKAEKSELAGVKGNDGVAGNPGFSSGNLRIIALDIKNAELLQVEQSGGDGSNGQHGGNGFDAVTPPEPEISRLGMDIPEESEEVDENRDGGSSSIFKFVFEIAKKAYYNRSKDALKMLMGKAQEVGYKCEESSVNTSELSMFVTMKSEITDFNIINEKPEMPPTNGGRGGDAGAGAVSGALRLYIKNQVAKDALQIFRKIGKSGMAGEGGTAGRNGPAGSFIKVRGRSNSSSFILFRLNNNERLTANTSMLGGSGQLPTFYQEASEGMRGETPETSVGINQRYNQESSLEKIFQMFSEFLEQNDSQSIHDPQVQAFQEFLASCVRDFQ